MRLVTSDFLGEMIHMKYDPSSISRADSITLSALLREVLGEERRRPSRPAEPERLVGDDSTCAAFEAPKGIRVNSKRRARLRGGHPADTHHEAVA